MNTKLSRRTIFLFMADILIIGAALLLALYLRLGWEGALFQLNENNGWLKLGLVVFVCLATLYLYDLYDYAVLDDRRELKARLVQALGSAWALIAVGFYFFPFLAIGRGTAVYSIFITLALLLIQRSWVHYVLGHPRIGEKILIVGDAEIVIDIANSVLNRRDLGLRIAGFIANDFRKVERLLPGSRHLGSIKNLEETVEKEKIDSIVIGVHERRGAIPPDMLLRLRLAGRVSIEESATFFERVTGRVHLDLMHPSWLIFSKRRRDTGVSLFSRDVIYRLLALIGLIVSFPAAVITAILIKIESEGPFFYRQERVGKDGQIFELIKFRSMRKDAEADGKPVWAADGDSRTTFVGRIIRKIRVDEIPQFWNIIKGDMNFIGPRPERPHFVSKLTDEVPFYDLRHLVPPGLTGWAQIKYPYGASVEDARKKLQYDLYYIKNQTLALDVMIFFETVKTVLFGRGGR